MNQNTSKHINLLITILSLSLIAGVALALKIDNAEYIDLKPIAQPICDEITNPGSTGMMYYDSADNATYVCDGVGNWMGTTVSGNITPATVTTTDGQIWLNTGEVDHLEGNTYKANYIYGYDDLHLWSDPDQSTNATIYLQSLVAGGPSITFYTNNETRMTINSTGNVIINQNLTVTKNTTIEGTLTVTNNTTIGGTLTAGDLHVGRPEGGYCSGAARQCGTYGDGENVACNNQDDCYWVWGPGCQGSARPCGAFSTGGDCTDQDGCSWTTTYEASAVFDGDIGALHYCDENGANCLATTAMGGSSLWTPSSGNVYRSSGNVGIGATDPGTKLDVNGTIRSRDFTSAGGQNIIVGDDSYLTDIDSNNMLGVYGVQNSDRAGIRLGSDGSYIFGDGGNIGIGLSNPSSKLEVDGRAEIGEIGTRAKFGKAIIKVSITCNNCVYDVFEYNGCILRWVDWGTRGQLYLVSRLGQARTATISTYYGGSSHVHNTKMLDDPWEEIASPSSDTTPKTYRASCHAGANGFSFEGESLSGSYEFLGGSVTYWGE